MDMVFHAADLMHKYLLLMANASEVRPRSRLFFFGDEFESIFSAENDVDEILNECVSQWDSYLRMDILRRGSIFVSRLKALGIILDPYPRLRRGLTCYRA
jgi:hypothetical protein